MATFVEALKNGTIKLSVQGEVKYNAVDNERHPTGIDGHNKKTLYCIYSVYKVENGVASAEYRNPWGQIRSIRGIRVEHLDAWTK